MSDGSDESGQRPLIKVLNKEFTLKVWHWVVVQIVAILVIRGLR